MSVKQRKNGNWEVRYRDPFGIHRSKTFKLKKDAVVFEKTIPVSLYRGEFIEPINKKITTGEIFIRYLNSKSGFKPKTKDDVVSLWNHIISPRFENLPISHINSERINNWINETVYCEHPITSPYRINRAIGYFARMLDLAIDLGYLNRNPLYRANGKLIRVETANSHSRRPPTALNWDQLKKLSLCCGNFEELVLLLGLCGLRWAEAVGLQVGDFSDGCKKLFVQRSMSEVRGVFHETTTKSGLGRTVYVPNSLALRIEKKISGLSPEDLVFCNEMGNPLHNSNFRQRVFNPAISASGVPKITIHDLRHTAASIAINRGAEITAVSRMLGHKDISMTLRVYSHHFEEDLMKLSEFIEQQINKGVSI